MLKNINLIMEDLDSYISNNYEEENSFCCSSVQFEECDKCEIPDFEEDIIPAAHSLQAPGDFALEDLFEDMGESFQEMLFRKIEEREMNYVEVYKRAGIDRRLSSKIRINPDYHPSKTIVLQLALSLRLTMRETVDLLATAEYAFSSSNKRDIIIQFFIEKGIYDMDTINYCLYEYDEPLLANPRTRGDSV